TGWHIRRDERPPTCCKPAEESIAGPAARRRRDRVSCSLVVGPAIQPAELHQRGQRQDDQQHHRQGGGVRSVPITETDFVDVVQQDRKSTRLNSSHVKISYAVF